MCSSLYTLNTKINSVKFQRGVCWEGVWENSGLCLSWEKWVHKWCSSIQESLRNCNDFVCQTSTVAEADDPFSMCITIDCDEFETVSEFCYLGGTIGQTGGCSDAVTSSDRWSKLA